MFQISRRVDYAVRIMIELGNQKDHCIPSRKISRRTNVPKAFLHKITKDLVKANLVLTQTGPKGGLSLNQPIEKINLQQIIEAVQGPICLNICLISPQECERDAICPAHDFWMGLQMSIVSQLHAKSLAMLVDEAQHLKNQPIQRNLSSMIESADIKVIQ